MEFADASARASVEHNGNTSPNNKPLHTTIRAPCVTPPTQESESEDEFRQVYCSQKQVHFATGTNLETVIKSGHHSEASSVVCDETSVQKEKLASCKLQQPQESNEPDKITRSHTYTVQQM